MIKPVDELPKKQTGAILREYAADIQSFLDGGVKVGEYIDKRTDNKNIVYSRLRNAARAHGYADAVRVSMRSGKIYLENIEGGRM